MITKPTADSKFGIDLHRLTEKHQHYHSSFRPYLRKGLVVTAGDDFERGLWEWNRWIWDAAKYERLAAIATALQRLR